MMSAPCAAFAAGLRHRTCRRCNNLHPALCVYLPTGKYMESECQGSAKTKCRTCEHEHFMDKANFLSACLPCTVCQEDQNLVTDTECKADQNRRCKCKEGFYCTDIECHHCRPATLCGPGSGVKEKPTAISDTQCERCPPGTFSDVTDFLTPCLNHTNCLGKELEKAGTPEANAQCKDTTSCKCILSISLGVGFAVILIVILATIFFFYWRTRRHSKMTVKLLQVKPEPLPLAHPDTELQYPTLCHDEKYSQNHCSSAVPIGHCMEMSDIECDCVAMSTLGLTQDLDKSVVGGGATGNHDSSSRYQSEPQENEWSET
ncbi:tumor necrosis factor receptor superfamily member 5 isoform X1 [Scleropages formosus]|uniref:tumor necrosis factor receptor superfamily member 5 isoform X1 n=1 Tax=Scleropages formosus TaxID=113540 RepID=UPI0010FA9D07|nr:tumor necrosis factor receptor superfamily member 5-like isoform X1 [Scleropages formosus]